MFDMGAAKPQVRYGGARKAFAQAFDSCSGQEPASAHPCITPGHCQGSQSERAAARDPRQPMPRKEGEHGALVADRVADTPIPPGVAPDDAGAPVRPRGRTSLVGGQLSGAAAWRDDTLHPNQAGEPRAWNAAPCDMAPHRDPVSMARTSHAGGGSAKAHNVAGAGPASAHLLHLCARRQVGAAKAGCYTTAAGAAVAGRSREET